MLMNLQLMFFDNPPPEVGLQLTVDAASVVFLRGMDVVSLCLSSFLYPKKQQRLRFVSSEML